MSESSHTFNSFFIDGADIIVVRPSLIAIALCIVFFVLPLQCFIIGNGMAIGVQGAVWRYQVADQGNSLILITDEIRYVTSGIYSGKSALMVALWSLGSVILTAITIFSLVKWNTIIPEEMEIIVIGIEVSGLLYLASLLSQYGVFFFGPAGIAIPAGVIILIILGIFLQVYHKLLFEKSHHTF